jgi:hypothetical protein
LPGLPLPGKIVRPAELYHYGVEGGIAMVTFRIDWGLVDNTNRANLKATRPGQKVNYIAAKDLVLVGNGHKKEHIDIVNHEEMAGMKCTGTIQVHKGDILGLDKGELIVTHARNRAEFQGCLRRITKKKITWAD